jgi:FkbM family methyltransferase
MMLNTGLIREVGPLKWAARTFVRQYYKRIARRDHAIRLPSGELMNLPIGSHFGSDVFINGADVDWGSERLLYSMLKGKGAFLDVGANIGYYCLYMLPRASSVVGFEPDPRVWPYLAANVAGKKKIKILPVAVGAEKGTASFTLDRVPEGSHLSSEGEAGGIRIDVEVVTLDSYVEGEGLAVDAIKIDVEGHDASVIAGSLGLMAGQGPVVLTEALPDERLYSLATKAGYRVFSYVRRVGTKTLNFRELEGKLPKSEVTKMLFLVPPGRVDELRRRAAP